MKKIFSLVIVCSICAMMLGCGSTKNNTEVSDLSGTWKQTNSSSKDSYQEAVISNGVIEINFVSDNGNTKSLYWSGSYEAPTQAVSEYSWDSKNDTSKTGTSMLASSDETKTMSYKDGVLSYSASMMGTTTTVKLEKVEEK